MRLADIRKNINEVSMTPTDFASSKAKAKEQNVLVGYEFEVCVPKYLENKVKSDKIDTEKLVSDFLDIIKRHDDYLKSNQFDNIFVPKENYKLSIPNSKKTFYFMGDAARYLMSAYSIELFDEQAIEKILKYNKLDDTEKFMNFFQINDLQVLNKFIEKYNNWFNEGMAELDQEKEARQQVLKDYDFDYKLAVKVLKPAVTKTFGKPIIFQRYHQEPKNLTDWYIEPDTSLEVNNTGDGAAEIVGPPEPIDVSEQTLKKFFDMAKNLGLYTNNKTGLHVNMSIPDMSKVDLFKLIVLLGDKHILEKFQRENSEYAQSAYEELKKYPNDLDLVFNMIKSGISNDTKISYLNDIANFVTGHRGSISRGGTGAYLSFRHIGKNYLQQYDEIVNTIGRFARILLISSDENLYKDDYHKKLYKFLMMGHEVVKAKDPASDKETVLQIIRDIKQNGMPVLQLDIASFWGGLDIDDVPYPIRALKNMRDLRMSILKNTMDTALEALKNKYPDYWTEERLKTIKFRSKSAARIIFYPIDYMGAEAILKFSKTQYENNNSNYYYQLNRLPLTDKKSSQLLTNIRHIMVYYSSKKPVTEVLDRPVHYTSNIGKTYFQTQTVINGKNYEFIAMFHPHEKTPYWHVGFHYFGQEIGRGVPFIGRTGKGDELSVFSFAKSSMEEFFRRYNPDTVYFSSDKSDPKRTNLYGKLASKYKPANYTLRLLTDPNEDSDYYVLRKQKNQEQKQQTNENEFPSNENLTEGATDILYHYTGITGAIDILKSGEFGLSILSGSDKSNVPQKYDYFLSTTRSKVGDYHRTPGNLAVMFVLDGRSIGQRYKVVPVDYWEQSWLKTHQPNMGGYRTSESEDRILSNEPTIPVKYAKEIHILVQDLRGNEKTPARVRTLIDLAEHFQIPHYTYFNTQAWRLQDKRHALSTEHEDEYFQGELPPEKDYKGTQWEPINFLSGWEELLDADISQRNNLHKRSTDLLRRLEYGVRKGEDLGLINDLHNARKPYGPERKSSIKILKFMRQNHMSIPDFVQYLSKKWERTR